MYGFIESLKNINRHDLVLIAFPKQSFKDMLFKLTRSVLVCVCSVYINNFFVTDLIMPAGYIKIEKSVNELQREVTERFNHVQFNELIDERQHLPSRFKILCVFLYTMISQKKINVLRSSRNFAKVRQQEIANYDRFVVLGVAGTSSVMLLFTPTSEDSKRLLGWYKMLRPGMPVWILSPKVAGFLKARFKITIYHLPMHNLNNLDLLRKCHCLVFNEQLLLEVICFNGYFQN